jgi:PilZ domain
MHSGHHRAQRFAFVAGIQITDVSTEKQLAAHTEDLSVFGCFVMTAASFPVGTKVRLRISHAGVNFIAQGKVAYSRSGGMGIAFTSIEPSSLSILDSWLAGLRN